MDKDVSKKTDCAATPVSLKELCGEYPREWEKVHGEIAAIIGAGRGGELPEYLASLKRRIGAAGGHGATGGSGRGGTPYSHVVQYRMATLAVKQHYVSVATGVESGRVRFNLLNGLIAQKLLFKDGLERKPVSMFWFRLLWPLVWQKRMLMPLVQPEGIYCFYSRELVDALAGLIGRRTCLEIAAGDGTLAAFLASKGCAVNASDDYSWEHAVKYPEFVVKSEAREALRRFSPEVVICSWPPSGNGFERQIFRTASVRLYIVIGSRHRHAAGNWADYEQQTNFSFEDEKRLGGLVLPPELDPAVYLFRRR